MTGKNASTAGPIRIGVVGVSRGMTFAVGCEAVGMEMVALCDTWEAKLAEAGRRFPGVTTYTDYDRFLEHDMDAVVLANYFHEHAPFAIKAFAAGKHVMSECAACHTLAEGVELIRAVEKSGRIYMFAENYPYMLFNQEMKRLYDAGVVGEFKYGEGEYVHPDPPEVKLRRACGWDHWRNWIPATYYCTHALAPVMAITGTRPVKVNGFVVPHDAIDPAQRLHVRRGVTAGPIMLRMNNDAVVKLLQGHLRGHQNFVRIHGSRGLMENCRHGDKQAVRLRIEKWEKKPEEYVEQVITPEFPAFAEAARRAGHGGGDFFTNYYFAEAIRSGEQPFLNVYRAVEMSIVGILAYRSALNDSAPVAVPDFRDEAARKAYEDDDWSPDPARREPGRPLPSILGHVEPTDEAKALARKVWRERGYDADTGTWMDAPGTGT